MEKEVQLIMDAGLKLRCHAEVIAKGLLLYHHFKFCVGDNPQLDSLLSAAAALNLSIKLQNDAPVDAKSLLLVFNSILKGEENLPSVTSDDFINLEKSLSVVESTICRVLEFNLNHKLAHQYIKLYWKSLQNLTEVKSVLHIATVCSWRLATDFYTSRKCLIYEASTIAAACIYVALYLCGKRIELYRWLEALSATCDMKKLTDIIGDILNLCDVKLVNMITEDC